MGYRLLDRFYEAATRVAVCSISNVFILCGVCARACAGMFEPVDSFSYQICFSFTVATRGNLIA